MTTQSNNPPADNHQERAYQSYGAVTRFGICPVCGRERPLGDDGTLIDHDHLITDHVGKYRQRCAGSGRFPELDK